MSNIKNKIKIFESLSSKNDSIKKNNSKKNTNKLDSEISYWNNITNKTNSESIVKEKQTNIDNSCKINNQSINTKINNSSKFLNEQINTHKKDNNYNEEDDEILNINNIIN